MKEEELKFTLRIPKSLHSRLTEVSEAEKRSLNNEILVLLEYALKELFPKE